MKKLLLLLFICASFLGYAQKFQLTAPDGTPYTDGQRIYTAITEEDLVLIGDPDGEHILEFVKEIIVENLLDIELEIRALLTTISFVNGMELEICFGACYPSGSFNDIEHVLLERGSEPYSIHLRPNDKFGLSSFKLEFLADDEKMTLYVDIDMTKIGVKEQNLAKASLSAYPNPASANTPINISYTLADKNDSRLVIRNILGAAVINIPLNPNETTVAIDASSLKSGVYFYAIENRNQISVAKKLIVK
jgi:hypothetical protein